MKDHLQDHLQDQLKHSDDYLWDRSGTPDAEIEKLEQALGALRYQPRPLAIPNGLKIGRPSFRRAGSRLAIAATVLLAIGAGLFWLNTGLDATKEQSLTANADANQTPADATNAAVIVPDDVRQEIPDEVPGPAPSGEPSDLNVTADDGRPTSGSKKTTFRRNRTSQPGSASQPRVSEPETPVLAANELKEAEAGKERLMLALRFASAKLNLALKKAQGTNNRNPGLNQHRIG